MDFAGYEEGILDPRYTATWGDQYALTMAQAFFTNNRHNTVATFHAYQREMPFGGSYMVTGGQNIIFEWLKNQWKFDARDQEMMRRKTVIDPRTGKPARVFTDAFIEFAANEPLRLSIDAMPEGELAFADEPIYRVHGPLWQCLMVEAAILNVTNSQSLFATLASHLVELADGGPILEFGLRRTQCIGGLEPTRGAWLGGASGIEGGGVVGTSNMLAEKFYGIPSVGTMAHALVMTYESELEAFKEYATAMPHNGVFLVDTYNTAGGVKKAIDTCRELGITLKGVRLDSGDMLTLSTQTRKLLDEAGFKDAKIVASDGLSYKKITELKAKKAPIDIWAIGGYLVNSPDQPSLGPVYKLGAVFGGQLSQAEIDVARNVARRGDVSPADPAFMREVIKMSEVAAKITIPGELDVLRYLFTDAATGKTRYDGDTIVPFWGRDWTKQGADGAELLAHPVVSVQKDDDTNAREFAIGTPVYRPLKNVFTNGAMVVPLEQVHTGRARAFAALSQLEQSHRGMPARYAYGVGIEEQLLDKRRDMIRRVRQQIRRNAA